MRSIGTNNTYTGTITLDTNSTIGVNSGSTLAIGEPGDPGTITGAFNLVKELTGTLILTGADSYGVPSPATFTVLTDGALGTTFPGGTVVAQGSLNVQNAGALGVPNTTTTVLDGAQLQVQDNEQELSLGSAAAGTTAFNLSFEGMTTATPILYTGIGGTGPGSDAYDIQQALDALSTTSGNVTVTPDVTDTIFTIDLGFSAGTVLPLISAAIAAAPGTATVTDSGITLPVTESLNLTGTGNGLAVGGALASVAGDNVVLGNITLAKNAGFAPTTVPASNVVIDAFSPNPGDMLTIQGKISQAAGLTLGLTADGTGVLVLDPLTPGNNNAYGGGTVVEAGILQIQQDLALGNNESTVVDSAPPCNWPTASTSSIRHSHSTATAPATPPALSAPWTAPATSPASGAVL